MSADWQRQRDTSEPCVRTGTRPSERVDLGLELLAMRARRGVVLTRYDIAAWCGCTNEAIRRIEQRAIVKLTNALRFTARGKFTKEL